jgi:hypothetical protein
MGDREVQDGGHDRGAHDRNEDARDRRPPASEADDDRDGGQAEGERPRVRQPVQHALRERLRFGDDVVTRHGEPEQLGQLADDDGQRDAVEIARPDGHREQVGDEAQPEDARPDADEAAEDRKCGREGHHTSRIPGGERQHDACDDRR